MPIAELVAVNATLPVSRLLVPEVFSEIMQYALAETPPQKHFIIHRNTRPFIPEWSPDRAPPPPVLQLGAAVVSSHVSYAWRVLCMGTPSLWAPYIGYNPFATKELLARSGHGPIDVWFVEQEEEKDCWLYTVSVNPSRIRSLDCHIRFMSEQSGLSLGRILSGNLQMLASLKIEVMTTPNEDWLDHIPVALDAPKLRSMGLVSLFLSAPCHDLQRLSLDCTSISILTASIGGNSTRKNRGFSGLQMCQIDAVSPGEKSSEKRAENNGKRGDNKDRFPFWGLTFSREKRDPYDTSRRPPFPCFSWSKPPSCRQCLQLFAFLRANPRLTELYLTSCDFIISERDGTRFAPSVNRQSIELPFLRRLNLYDHDTDDAALGFGHLLANLDTFPDELSLSAWDGWTDELLRKCLTIMYKEERPSLLWVDDDDFAISLLSSSYAPEMPPKLDYADDDARWCLGCIAVNPGTLGAAFLSLQPKEFRHITTIAVRDTSDGGGIHPPEDELRALWCPFPNVETYWVELPDGQNEEYLAFLYALSPGVVPHTEMPQTPFPRLQTLGVTFVDSSVLAVIAEVLTARMEAGLPAVKTVSLPSIQLPFDETDTLELASLVGNIYYQVAMPAV